MSFMDILNEIENGENIEEHVKSPDTDVRQAVANKGYKLDVLVNDPSEDVRAAVARKGYGLSKLREDKSQWVRFAVLETIDKLSKHNAGYDIIGNVNLGDSHYALGYNPKAPAPYVTWSFNPTTASYYYGHYFTDKNAASLDLIKRVADEIDLGEQSIGIELLTENDRHRLDAEFRDGDVLHIFEDELYFPKKEISKPSLDQQIKSAEDRGTDNPLVNGVSHERG